MTTDLTTPTRPGEPGTSGDPDWRAAGRAWGARARDWADLFEPYAVPAYEAVLPRAGVTGGTRYLDVACGSGLAATFAHRRGARVAGVDASEELLAIARERVPDGEFRAGDLDELPWADAAFDVVTAFNGIWYGNDRALEEVHRVLRPGGTVALTFWGDPARMDHAAYFLAIAACSAPDDGQGVIDLGRIAAPGVAESMCAAAGLVPSGRGTVRCASEWPDDEIAARALVAPGVAHHALEHVGIDVFVATALEALRPYRSDAGYRLASDLDFLVATKP